MGVASIGFVTKSLQPLGPFRARNALAMEGVLDAARLTESAAEDDAVGMGAVMT